MTIYRVGSRPYRGHGPGDEFEAVLDPAAERRALDRGAITVVRAGKPALEPGSYRLPADEGPEQELELAHEAERTMDEPASDSDQ